MPSTTPPGGMRELGPQNLCGCVRICRYRDDMVDPSPPKFRAGSFTCPHCDAICQQIWAKCDAFGDDGSEFDPGIFVTTCFVCEKRVIWRLVHRRSASSTKLYEDAEIIWPAGTGTAPPRHSDMPENVSQLYSEAASVSETSPRSAAALLRLALELLLTDLYPQATTLNGMIAAAAASGLPDQVTNMMDIMRFSGNENIHAFRPDDGAADAATMFLLLNVVVERLIALPNQVENLFDALPEGMKEQVVKRNGA